MSAPASWLPDALLGTAVALFGVAEAVGRGDGPASMVTGMLVALGMGGAAGLFRLAPGQALALVWLACGVQVLSGSWLDTGFGTSTGIAPMFVQLAAVVVAYGTGRHGSAVVVWASGLSIPAASMIGILLRFRVANSFYDTLSDPDVRQLLPRLGIGLVLGVLAVLVLAVPWLLGLALRSRQNARRAYAQELLAQEGRARAEVDRSQAEELATLRDRQNQLARDVHDVVGHSLTVILAQAESAQFLPDDDPQKIRTTMANIADSARQSLRDVREVLSPTTTSTSGANGGLDSLVDGVRAAGNDIRSAVAGSPQPLPPELALVAYRVLQEMLTNALKHGRRGEPVHVEQHWAGDLRMEVRNIVDDPADTLSLRPTAHDGLGVDGMRRRLESVGGRLDVRRREEAGVGQTFTATAWVPVRSQPGSHA